MLASKKKNDTKQNQIENGNRISKKQSFSSQRADFSGEYMCFMLVDDNNMTDG